MTERKIIKLAKTLRDIGCSAHNAEGGRAAWKTWQSLEPAYKAGWVGIAKYIDAMYVKKPKEKP